MSKVALRVYTREIETLVDQGNIDEAVAHCMHILKIYPKNLETYRLMGKAYLEGHRYSDAADIFQRVLLAAPDDFVAHLGMSIVFDEQNDLPAAIWHMERAFEINSTNGGIQSELRRLYSRRDGLEPPKIHLTRGALAQIYAKGGEYQQAISETRSVLADEANRNDMKTLLARCYFRAGMKNEAVEVCMDLLKQYPYSLDGNRIMADILPGTSMAQGAEQYRRRILALDPYAAATTGSIFETDSVPDTAVMVERLEPDASSLAPQDWKMPSQPASPFVPAQPSGLTSEQPTAAVSSAPEEAIPDWMQASGWGPSNGEHQEGETTEAASSADMPVGELAAADIPDWLRAMAPPGAGPAGQEAPAEEADFDWLASLGAPAAPEAALAGSVSEPAPVAEVPGVEEDELDWLTGLTAPVETNAQQDEARAASVENELDWLKGLGAPADIGGSTMMENVPSGKVPEWLRGLGEPGSENERPAVKTGPGAQATAEQVSTPQPAAGEPAAKDTADEWTSGLPAAEAGVPGEQGVPDWLSGLSAELPASPQPASESVPDWLSSLSAAEQAPQAGSVSSEQASSDLAPDWLSTPAASEAASAADEGIPNWLSGLGEQESGSEPYTEAGESVPDWMSGLSAPEPAGFETRPDWINSITSEEPAPAAEPVPAETVPGWLSTPGAQEQEPAAAAAPDESARLEEEAPGWLDSLSEPVGAQAPDEQIPGWLDEVKSGPAQHAESESEADKALRWLQSLSGEAAVADEGKEIPMPAAEIPVTESPNVETPAGTEQITSPPTAQAEAAQPQVERHPAPLMDEFSSAVSAPEVSDAEQAEAFEWLENLVAGQAPAAETPAVEQAPEAEILAAAPVASEDVIPPLSELVSGPGTSESEQEDALKWLESLAQKHGAKPEELLTSPDDRQETTPGWVTGVVPAAETPAVVQAPEAEILAAAPVAGEDVIPPLSELVSGPGTTEDEQEDALKWLESLARKHGAKPEELLTSPDDRQETAPGWVTGVVPTAETPAAEQAPEAEILAAAPVAGEDVIPPLSELVSGPGTSESEQDDALKWLESLAQKHGARPEELLTNPSERQETAPDWVTGNAPAPETEIPAAEESVPDWLSALPAEEKATGKVPAAGIPAAEESISEWLIGLSAVEKAPERATEVAAPVTDETFVPPPLSELVSGPGTSEDEQEDALKWLESLAQKQGARPEELLTNPSERQETAPDWVTGNVPAPVAGIPAAEESIPDWLTALPVEEDAPEPEASTPGAETREDSLAWQQEQSPEAPALIAAINEGTPSAPPDDILGWLGEYGTASAGFEPEAAAPVRSVLPELGEEQPGQPVQQEPVAPILYVQPANDNLLDDSLEWQGVHSGEEPSDTAHETYLAPVEPPQDTLGWLEEYGTASVGIAEAATEASMAAESGNVDADLDWLGDLSQPGAVLSEPQAAQEEQIPAGAPLRSPQYEIPDTPDVSLDWLASARIEEKSSEEPVQVAGLKPEEEITGPLEDLAWALEPVVTAGEPVEAGPEITDRVVEPAAVDIAAEMPVSPPETGLPQSDAGEDLEWLRGLQSNEPAKAMPWELEAMDDSAVQEPLAQEESKPEDLLPWETEQAPVEPAALPVEPVGAVSEWLSDTGAQEEARPEDVLPPWETEQALVEPAASATEPMGAVSEWLSDAGAQEESKPGEAMPWETEPAPAAAPEPASDTGGGDISEWLKSLEDEQADQDWDNLDTQTPAAQRMAPSWLQENPTQTQQGTGEVEELPDWLKDESVEDEDLPVSVPVQAWMPASESTPQDFELEVDIQDEELVTEEDEEQAAEQDESESFDPLEETLESAAAPAPGIPTLPRLPLEAGDKDAEAVQKARDLLGGGGLDGAMKEYVRLIRRGKMLEEVIYDLQEAVYRHPVDVIVWQTLGDAYMRSNRLQEALDAYSKAEELLR